MVHSRLDTRLEFVGSIVPDKNWRGLVTFSLPPLDAGAYTIAYWCPACSAHSRGRTFFVQRPEQFVQRYRAQVASDRGDERVLPGHAPQRESAAGTASQRLVVRERAALRRGFTPMACTRSRRTDVAADGSIGDKLLWVTTPPWQTPTLSGERLDAPATATARAAG